MSLQDDVVLVEKGRWALVDGGQDEGPVMRHNPCPQKIETFSYTIQLRRVKHPKCSGCKNNIPKWLVHLYTVSNMDSLDDSEYFEQEGDYNELV